MTAVHSNFPPDVAAAKSVLSNIKLNNNADTNLYQHITNVLTKLITEQHTNDNTDLINKFQQLSAQLKHNNANSDNTAQTLYSNSSATEQGTKLAEATVQHYKNSLATYQHPTVDEDNEPIEIDYNELINTNLPDIQSQATLLQRAGVSIGTENWYKVQLAINKLIQQEKSKDIELTEITYWGQITTKSAAVQSYTIVQVVPETWPEVEDDESNKDLLTEEYGTGVNSYLYYVTTSLDNPTWTQLPLLTATAMSIGRTVHQFVTGDLNAVVTGFPRFPYNEAMYLRCIIARITHSTHICPKTAYIYEPDNDEPTVIVNEEFHGLPASDLLSSNNWTHYKPVVRRDGRTSIYVSDDSDIDSVKQQANTVEREIPQLRNIASDGTQAWALRITPCADIPSSKPVADPTIHTVVDDSVIPKHIDTRSVAVVKSMIWPGAITVAYNKQYLNVYHGNGLKQNTKPYKPLSPHKQQIEVSSSTTVECEDVSVEPAKPVKELDEDGNEIEPESESEEEVEEDEPTHDEDDDI